MTTALRGVPEFNAAFQRWAHGETRQAVVNLQRHLTLRVLTGVVLAAPVGNPTLWKHKRKDGSPIVPKGYIGGSYRGEWQIGVGVSPETETGRIDKGGQATLGAESGKLAALKADAPFTFVSVANNSPYAKRIETGWSSQAPQGVLAVQLNHVTLEVDAELGAGREPAP